MSNWTIKWDLDLLVVFIGFLSDWLLRSSCSLQACLQGRLTWYHSPLWQIEFSCICTASMSSEPSSFFWVIFYFPDSLNQLVKWFFFIVFFSWHGIKMVAAEACFRLLFSWKNLHSPTRVQPSMSLTPNGLVLLPFITSTEYVNANVLTPKKALVAPLAMSRKQMWLSFLKVSHNWLSSRMFVGDALRKRCAIGSSDTK